MITNLNRVQIISYFLGLILISFLFTSCTSSSFLSKVNPTTFYYDGHIYLKAKVNSTDCILDMDTGAEALFLDSTFFYTKIDSTALVDFTLEGVGTQKRKIKVYADLLIYSLANKAKAQQYTPILNLQHTARHPSDGIFGFHFMENKVIGIDFVNQLLYITESTQSLPLNDFQKIPFELKDKKIIIDAAVQFTDNFTYNGKFVVDTGSDNTLNFTSDFAKIVKLDTIIKNKVHRNSIAMGIGNYSSNFSFNLPKLSIADSPIHNVFVDYSVDESGALSSSNNYDGIIGNSILERFDILIDYTTNHLYLKPNKRFITKESNEQLLFSLLPTESPVNGWLVHSKVSSPHFDKNELQLGDVITHVNGQNVNELKITNFIKQQKKKTNKTKLILNRNGKIVHLTIESIILKMER